MIVYACYLQLHSTEHISEFFLLSGIESVALECAILPSLFRSVPAAVVPVVHGQVIVPLPLICGGLSDDARLTSVCLGLSREQRGLGRPKLVQR